VRLPPGENPVPSGCCDWCARYNRHNRCITCTPRSLHPLPCISPLAANAFSGLWREPWCGTQAQSASDGTVPSLALRACVPSVPSLALWAGVPSLALRAGVPSLALRAGVPSLALRAGVPSLALRACVASRQDRGGVTSGLFARAWIAIVVSSTGWIPRRAPLLRALSTARLAPSRRNLP
jgi:hypothetical protein